MHLWNEDTGALIGSWAIPGPEPASGWVEYELPSPIPLDPNVDYMISYNVNDRWPTGNKVVMKNGPVGTRLSTQAGGSTDPAAYALFHDDPGSMPNTIGTTNYFAQVYVRSVPFGSEP